MKALKTYEALTAYKNSLNTKGYSSENSFPFDASIKGKKYRVEILSKRIGALEKFGTGLKAFALTLLSGGFALFSEEVRASWLAAFSGKKVVVVCNTNAIMDFSAFTLSKFKIGDKEEALKILEDDPLMFSYVSKKNHNDRDVLWTVCSNLGGRSFATDDVRRLFDKKQLDDKELMMLVVSSDPFMLKHLSPRLQEDKEIVRTAVEKSPLAFRHASPILKKDRGFVLEMVSLHGWTLKFADPSMGEDEEIVRKAIETFPGALNAAALQFRGDREIVLLAIQQERIELFLQSPIFCSIPTKLQSDRDVYLAALRLKPAANEQDPLSYQKRTVQKIIENFVFNAMPEEAKEDRELFSILVTCDVHALQYAADALKDDRDLVINSHWLEYASDRLLNDKEFVLEAINSGCSGFMNVSESLKDNEEVALEAFKSRCNFPISDRLRRSVEFFRKLMKEKINFDLFFMDPVLLQNQEFVEELLRFAPFRFLQYKNIPRDWILSSLRNATKLEQFNMITVLNEEFSSDPEFLSAISISVGEKIA